MRYIGLAYLLAVTACPAICRADETIVLDLPSSRSLINTTSTYTDAAPKSSGRSGQSAPSPDRRGGSMRSGPKEKIVGKLGVVSLASSIHSRHSSEARTLAKVQPGTYLALTNTSGDWFGVLMADQSTGWINKQYVKLLDYEVTTPDSPQNNHYAGGSAPTLEGMNGGARTILEKAYSFLGVPYRYGGNSPNGIDCSAFVQRCFNTVGISLPRTAHEQIECGMPVSTADLRAGDRLYFASRGRISHTGIYIGNGYFIHASSSRGGVAVSRLSESLYSRMYAGARR